MKKKHCVVEVYQRITGFFRPIKVWNPGKKEEYKDRKKYEIDKIEMYPPIDRDGFK